MRLAALDDGTAARSRRLALVCLGALGKFEEPIGPSPARAVGDLEVRPRSAAGGIDFRPNPRSQMPIPAPNSGHPPSDFGSTCPAHPLESP